MKASVALQESQSHRRGASEGKREHWQKSLSGLFGDLVTHLRFSVCFFKPVWMIHLTEAHTSVSLCVLLHTERRLCFQAKISAVHKNYLLEMNITTRRSAKSPCVGEMSVHQINNMCMTSCTKVSNRDGIESRLPWKRIGFCNSTALTSPRSAPSLTGRIDDVSRTTLKTHTRRHLHFYITAIQWKRHTFRLI